MCEIYSGAEPELFELKTRSIRMNGLVTSIRLEAVFWKIIEQIAADAELKLSEFLSTMYDEVLLKRGSVNNFSSLLRVACTTYMNKGERLSLT